MIPWFEIKFPSPEHTLRGCSNHPLKEKKNKETFYEALQKTLSNKILNGKLGTQYDILMSVE